jgi:hypothetical protein
MAGGEQRHYASLSRHNQVTFGVLSKRVRRRFAIDNCL